ncbi:PREDICTED: myotubularin-related protein 14 isoform X3 [Nanorana parkeri]|uniref:myotubularin-related protein 14 isoform X3 n=1 Tax=Nanorana parkeri TaxID=125878 RepID=UPI0008545585|nr:PREDICTED: myotubularin-related protein 14 isoform X3 [Nanorana parkeri]
MEESGRHNGLGELLEEFSRAQFRAKDVGPKVERIERRCLELFGKDYFYSIIQNPNGELCSNYPRQIVFLEYESTEEDKHMFESTMQVGKLQDLINRSKMARCRGRFVCPVILYKGKHICRSATLAGWGELYGRAGYNYIFSGGSDDAGADTEVADDDAAARNGDSQFDKVRGHDIKVLRYLSVRYICDLMVENKKVKFGVNVTSSEKVDKAQRYADFTLLSIPYPGCEFFKDYKERDYAAEGLVFNWKQDYVDAPLNIPPCLTRNLHIDWREYQSWDLVKQTQNYLRLLIHIINGDDSSGLLVHCISGWDRTPLFVSLLRLSLWADGMVHRSLEPAEILYLTIAYDWFLFGHMLADRLCKGEEIFFFCFNFLKHITSDEFSSSGRKSRRKSSQPRDPGLLMEDFCALKPRDRGSNTSLSSDFSVITEDSSSAFGNSNYEAVDLMTFGAQSHAVWKKTHPSSPHTVLWNRTAEEHMLYPLGAEAKSSSSSSSNHSDIFMRAGSSPLEVPQRNWDTCRAFPPLSATSERAAKLEAVKSIFLSAYNTAIGLKTVSPSPSGAISGLLEQFARGVGLRGPSAIV